MLSGYPRESLSYTIKLTILIINIRFYIFRYTPVRMSLNSSFFIHDLILIYLQVTLTFRVTYQG